MTLRIRKPRFDLVRRDQSQYGERREDCQENVKKNFRDVRGGTCYSGKPEQRGHDRDDQENSGPTKYGLAYTETRNGAVRGAGTGES